MCDPCFRSRWVPLPCNEQQSLIAGRAIYLWRPHTLFYFIVFFCIPPIMMISIPPILSVTTYISNRRIEISVRRFISIRILFLRAASTKWSHNGSLMAVVAGRWYWCKMVTKGSEILCKYITLSNNHQLGFT